MITCLPRGVSGRGCRFLRPHHWPPGRESVAWGEELGKRAVRAGGAVRARTGGRAGLDARHGARPAAPPVADGGAARVRRPHRPASGPSTDGLAEQVRTASCDHGIKRWRPYLTQEQVASVARGLWPHRMAGSAAETDRFACEYGVVHSPARGSGEGPPAARRGAGSSGRVWLAGRGRC
ncbi:DUF6417 family protein [Streptomyces mirabilis]|uniref:DUF6417 family protein n=1 Tax=Streptomyces mirabilis TaxID=68239 RepID=UPI00369C1130